MPFHQPDSVKYYTFSLFEGQAVSHAVFSRQGGVSSGPWTSLNVGLTVGDDPKNVAQNRQIAFDTLGREVQTLSDSWLVHGKDAVVYDAPRPREQKLPPKADIILTDNPQVSLFMRYADCVPILLYDPQKRAIALAHAGWQGTVKHVAQAAVEAMQARFGSHPAEILAAIGPSIGPQRYPVGEEVVRQVEQAFGEDASGLLPHVGCNTHFDLWAANRLTLEQAGVRKIDLPGLCTASNTADWFSHRAEDGKTGRFGVLLALTL